MAIALLACESAPKASLNNSSRSSDASTNGTDANTMTSPDAGTAEDAGVAQNFPKQVSLSENERPAVMHIPDGYDGLDQLPLVIQLHGYSVDADIQESYFRLSTRVDARRFFLIRPNGTVENSQEQNRFWNAIPNACCNFYGSRIDDVAYLNSLIAEAKANYPVDASRVYFIGHSNGGFMSYRMACENAGEITAIVSLAGSTFKSESDCKATEPVSVLQIHGDQDGTIPYNGRSMGSYGYPSAPIAVERWAERAGCDVTQTTEEAAIDFDYNVSGDETRVFEYTYRCQADISSTLWHIQGGGHIPGLTAQFPDQVLDWMLKHQK